MTGVPWKLGEALELVLDGQSVRHRVVARARGGLELVSEDDGEVRWMRDVDLERMWVADDLRRVRDPDATLNDVQRLFVSRSIDAMTDSERAHANWLSPYLAAIRRSKETIGASSRRKLEVIIDRVAKEKGHARKPGWRTIGNHHRQMLTAGADGRWLAPRVSARGNRTPRYGGFEATIDRMLREFVLVPNRRPLTIIHAELQKALDAYVATALPDERVKAAIDLRTVQRRVRAFRTDERVAAWKGPEKARREHRPVGVGPAADRPMQRVEIDHTTLDVLVTDPRTGTTVGRPCLTVAIDKCTRMVLGMHIGFEEPSGRTVLLCLRQAIMPKVELLRGYGLPLDAWPCHGVPEAVVFDNGLEFHGSSLDDATTQLGIDVHYCAVRTPDQKGTVERWFGSLNTGLIHALPGTTKSNPRARGEYDSDANATLTIVELRKLVVRWVVEIYSRQLHKGIATSPLDRWLVEVASHPVGLPTEVQDLDVLLCPAAARVLTRQGVEMHGLRYTGHERIGALLNDAEKPREVVLKYDPDDLGEIRMLDWQTKRYLRLRCIQWEYADGLTLWQHREITRAARAKTKETVQLRQSELIESRVRLGRDLTELQLRGRSRGRKAARLIGADEDALPNRFRKTSRPRSFPKRPDLSLAPDDDFTDLGITVETIR